MKNGHGEAGADHEQPAEVPDLGALLGLGADHEAGGVAQEQDRDLVGVAELEEPGRLVRAVAVDGPAEVARVVGHDTDGRPSIRTSAVTMPVPNPARSSSTEPVSARMPIRSAMS